MIKIRTIRYFKTLLLISMLIYFRQTKIKIILGLLDSGANGNFTKRESLESMTYQKKWQGNSEGKIPFCGSEISRHIPNESPNFYTSRKTTTEALVEKSEIGRHDFFF